VVWLKLDAGLPMNGVWQDWTASRLWIWLLCKAKTSSTPGTVRFSYRVVARQIGGMDGMKKRRPSTKVLRRALRLLAQEGRVSVAEWVQGWEQARAQGGGQGYLNVSICNWGTYQEGASASDTGSGIGYGTGSGASRAQVGHTKKRKREIEKEEEAASAAVLPLVMEEKKPSEDEPFGASYDSSDRLTLAGFANLWNVVAKAIPGMKTIRTLDARGDGRRKGIRAILKIENDDNVLAEAFRCLGRKDWHVKNGHAKLDSFLVHYAEYLDEARNNLDGQETR